jgi:hypothetical protein
MKKSYSQKTEYVHTIKSLLVGATVANFEYWSDFIIRVQREVHPANEVSHILGDIRLPPMFCVRLRNKWWLGILDEWQQLIAKFPIKSPSGIAQETPLQASAIVAMLESTIIDISISETGDLEISLSSGDKLHAQGAGGQWEESWFIELPADDPDRDKWSIICTSDGTIHIRLPATL